MRAAPLLVAALVIGSLRAQSRILYPKARFEYQYPSAPATVERHADAWLRQNAVPKGSVRELETWPIPVPSSPLETFADGPHLLVTVSPSYDDHSVHFASLVAAVSEEDGHAFKIEAGHHRTAVWGTVHAWKHYEWGGDGKAIPEEYPVFAMYEMVFTGIEAGKGVFSRTRAFRVSHLRVDGAGEEFIGDVSDYQGAGRDQLGRTGLAFRRRTVNFAVDLSVRGPRPVVTWHRGPRGSGWRQDPVHNLDHAKEWREQVDELHSNPPPPKQRESEFFCLLGSSKRGLRRAKVASILSFTGWGKRRERGLRPAHVLHARGRRKKLAFQPKLRPHRGFVRRKGSGYSLVSKELGVSVTLDVPDDLAPLLEAWLANFP